MDATAAIGPTAMMGGKALGLVLKGLGPHERQRLGKSFRQAAESCRQSPEEEEALETRRGRAWHRIKKTAKVTARVPGRATKKISKRSRKARQTDEHEISVGNGAKQAFKTVSKSLTKAWTKGGLAESRWLNEAAQGTWISFLEECLTATAIRNRAEPEWRYVVGGDSKVLLDDSDIAKWAQAMARELGKRWRSDPQLGFLLAQLNLESGLGLQGALVAASHKISERLLWITLAIVGMTLLGGGGIALLVLFIDKG